jgi:hypothetical protein
MGHGAVVGRQEMGAAQGVQGVGWCRVVGKMLGLFSAAGMGHPLQSLVSIISGHRDVVGSVQELCKKFSSCEFKSGSRTPGQCIRGTNVTTIPCWTCWIEDVKRSWSSQLQFHEKQPLVEKWLNPETNWGPLSDCTTSALFN